MKKFIVNLPPTLSKSQLESVKKQMKIQLLSILKHQNTESLSEITDLLMELGMSQNEVTNSVMRLKLQNFA